MVVRNTVRRKPTDQKKIAELLDKKHQLQEIYSEDQFYLIKNNIFNFKIKSSVENSFNLITLENMVKVQTEDNK